MNNWKESRIYKENVRNLQDTLQRARERNEQEYCERLKSKKTPMLVNVKYYTCTGVQNSCPNCGSNKIKVDHNYCPTCGQRLLWVNIYDTKATTEDNENVKKGE